MPSHVEEILPPVHLSVAAASGGVPAQAIEAGSFAQRLLTGMKNSKQPSSYEMFSSFPPAVNRSKGSRKRIVGSNTFELEVMKASVAPPLGPWLGGFGVKAADVVKNFNNMCEGLFRPGFRVDVTVNVYVDKSFDLLVHRPTYEQLILNACKVPTHTPRIITPLLTGPNVHR